MPGNACVIGLLSDFGLSDPYVAEMKAAILGVAPRACLIDITHTIAPYAIAQGAFVLLRAAAAFPPGACFVAVVDPGVGTVRRGMAMENDRGQRFVGPDNGLFGYVLEQTGCRQAVELAEERLWLPVTASATFHGRDRFAPVAAHLAAESAMLEALGPSIEPESLIEAPLPLLSATVDALPHLPLDTHVLHIDHFGNVILNLAVDGPLPPGRMVRVTKEPNEALGFEAVTAATYGEREPGELLLLTNSAGFLELAANRAPAHVLLNVKPGDAVTCTW